MVSTTNTHKAAKTLIKDLKFCIFDLETTGGNHEKDKIIEIGLVKVDKLKIVAQKTYLLQPEIKIPSFIQKLTSISAKEVENAKLIEDVIDDILDFMGDRILIAHNTSFDIPFFNSVLTRLGKKSLKNKNLCTNLMTKHLIPNLLNSNLNYMSKIFKIQHKQAHRALDDALATANLLIKYLQIFIDKDISKINHLYYPRNRYELDMVNIKDTDKKNKLLKSLKSFTSPFLIIFKGLNGVILFALPCAHTENETLFIKKMASKLNWKTITIKLYGSVLESIIHLNNHFTKIENELRNDIIQFLWKEHLANYKMPQQPLSGKPDSLEKNTIEVSDKEIGSFIILGHLVPEQYIIFPIVSMHPKSSLIFRFPGHQKKLLQHLKSKTNKIQNNKIRRIPYPAQLRKFITHYLQYNKENNNRMLMFPISRVLKKDSESFLLEIKHFTEKNSFSYNYPREYV